MSELNFAELGAVPADEGLDFSQMALPADKAFTDKNGTLRIRGERPLPGRLDRIRDNDWYSLTRPDGQQYPARWNAQKKAFTTPDGNLNWTEAVTQAWSGGVLEAGEGDFQNLHHTIKNLATDPDYKHSDSALALDHQNPLVQQRINSGDLAPYVSRAIQQGDNPLVRFMFGSKATRAVSYGMAGAGLSAASLPAGLVGQEASDALLNAAQAGGQAAHYQAEAQPSIAGPAVEGAVTGAAQFVATAGLTGGNIPAAFALMGAESAVEHEKRGRELGLNTAESTAYGTVHGAVDYAVNKFLGDKLGGTVMEALGGGVKDAVKEGLVQALKRFGGSLATGAGFMAGNDVAHQAVDRLLNADPDALTPARLKETVKNAVVGSTVFGLLGHVVMPVMRSAPEKVTEWLRDPTRAATKKLFGIDLEARAERKALAEVIGTAPPQSESSDWQTTRDPDRLRARLLEVAASEGRTIGDAELETRVSAIVKRRTSALPDPVPAVAESSAQQPVTKGLTPEVRKDLRVLNEATGRKHGVIKPDLLTPEQNDAVAFAKERGVDVHFVKPLDGGAPAVGGMQRHENLMFIDAAHSGDSLWGIVGHELAHNKSFDLVNNIDPYLVAQAYQRYRAISTEKQKNRLDADPVLRQREGVARLVQEFATNPELRAKIGQENPTLWQRIRNAIVRVLNKFTPQGRANNEILDFFRNSKVPNAEAVRANPRPPQGNGNGPEIGQDQGGQDIQQPTPEQPSGTVQRPQEKAITPPPVEPPAPIAAGIPEGDTTAAKNESMARDRRLVHLEDLFPPEAVTWQQNRQEAIDQHIPERAVALAAQVNLKPRSLSATETAGLVLEMQRLKNLHVELSDQLKEAGDAGDIQLRAVALSRIEQEMDMLSRAARVSGTEEGRALAARKLTINQDYDLLSIKTRSKHAKGENLAPSENLRLADFAQQIKKVQANIERLRQQLESGNIEIATPRVKPPVPEQLERLLYEEARLKQEIRRYIQSLAPKSVFSRAHEGLNAARSLMTSYDLSAVLRQGGFIAIGNPLLAIKASGAMFRALTSDFAARKINDSLYKRANALLYEKARLYLSDADGILSQQEEAYMGRLAQRIPVIGRGVQMSERAYTTFLNVLRADAFDAMVRALGKGGEVDLVEAQHIARYINIATGRGSFGSMESAMTGLGGAFFAPRYAASRFQLLVGVPLKGGTWRTKKLIAKEYAKYLTGMGVIYALGQAAGATIESDSRSSDFGKLKWGNTRLDPLSGLSQATVLLSRVASGSKLNNYGEEVALRGDEKPPTGENAWDVSARFLRSKLAPLPAAAADLLTGENVVGQPVTPQSVIANAVTPLAPKDIVQAIEDQGVARGTAQGLVALFGMNLQTFTKQLTPEQYDALLKAANARPTTTAGWDNKAKALHRLEVLNP